MNNTVSISNSDLIAIKTITQQLRVPELSYRAGNGDDLSGEINAYLLSLSSTLTKQNSVSVSKHLIKTLDARSLPPILTNLAFYADRVFDVWGRKNRLHSEINQQLIIWRFPFFKCLYQKVSVKLFTKFIVLIEAVASSCLVWIPKPERSKKVILDELHTITDSLLSAEFIDESLLDNLISNWTLFSNKQSEKCSKVIVRLISAEDGQSWAAYCTDYAKNYLNSVFKNQAVSQALQLFIQTYWLEVLINNIAKDIKPKLTDEVKTLTAKIKAVFCTKGEAAFKWADSLLEDMQSRLLDQNINVEEKLWQSLATDVVNILQGNDIKESKYDALTSNKGLEYFAENLQINNLVQQGDWFYFVSDTLEIRQQLVAIFQESQEALFCNYLGMKVKRYAFKELDNDLKFGQLKPLQAEALFSEVLKKTSAGLLKVAETQKKARVIAAEKAIKEAKALIAEKEQADKAAAIKAEEIAQRTKNILQKRKEKKRLEQETEIYIRISKCKLGAWIVITNENVDQQRYKLVVKLTASDKFIFVDKIGIKKIEFSEQTLMNGIMNNEIEIISDGAEFEQSLERVVSRLREAE